MLRVGTGVRPQDASGNGKYRKRQVQDSVVFGVDTHDFLVGPAVHSFPLEQVDRFAVGVVNAPGVAIVKRRAGGTGRVEAFNIVR